MTQAIRVVTYNIHKGFSQFNQRMVLHDLRDQLRGMHADLVFLQEVVGAHDLHAEKHENWPETSQYEFLADSIWEDYAYGKNAVYPEGHHGNAILSRFPIVSSENVDVSAHRFEQRGLLHCEVRLPGWDETATKLDLAKAYIDMGDAEGARSILDEVMVEGNDQQKQQARDLASQIAA